jgi:hypothetical protein
MSKAEKKFTVVGPLRVHGKSPGEELSLDPVEPSTVRLLARGQIVLVSSRGRSADAPPVDDDPATGASEEKE